MIDVQVDRPVTIKANGKTIKLTNDEARELARKLNAALDVKTFPSVPWYPYTTAPWGNDPTIWYESTDDHTLVTSDTTSAPMWTYTVSPIEIVLT